MNNKISIYGSSGFIGSRYCNLFSDEVIKIPREQNTSESNELLYFISTTTNYNIFDKPFLDVETNLIKLLEVLEANKNQTELIFNFVSSWFVYGKTLDLPATELSVCDPKGFYSITKRTAEQMLISYCETHNMKYRILRLCNVIGESDAGVSKKKNALQFMIGNLKNNEDIQLYDDGEHVRDYMYVDDVCNAIKCCISNSSTNDIINIGSGKPTKIKDVIMYCKNSLGSKSKIESIEPPEFHKIVQVKNMYLDVNKLHKTGFKQQYTIWSAIDKILLGQK
tara:strand:- start:302 stop:1141 length:840 start_codon:yes stop_codon:yes gene_type:complete